jgi:hypothetical protein
MRAAVLREIPVLLLGSLEPKCFKRRGLNLWLWL